MRRGAAMGADRRRTRTSFLRANSNLGTIAQKIVARQKIVASAGIQAWLNFFNNLRASFATGMLKIARDYQVRRWTAAGSRTLRNFSALVATDEILLAIQGFADHHAEAKRVPQKESGGGETRRKAKVSRFAARIQPVLRWEWAMRDSNPRHLRCKRSTLAN